jgi:hypothetical protein
MALLQRIDKSPFFRTLLEILGSFLLALVITVVGWLLIAWIGLARIIINITGVSYAAYNTFFLWVFVVLGVAFSLILTFGEINEHYLRKHDVVLHQVTPTDDMIRSMRGEVCARCGEKIRRNKMCQPHEQFYEVYPQYKGKQICLDCARERVRESGYLIKPNERLKDSQGRATL